MFGFKKNRISINPIKCPYQGRDNSSLLSSAWVDGEYTFTYAADTLNPHSTFVWNGSVMTSLPNKASGGEFIQNLRYIGKIGIHKYYRGYINGSTYAMYFFRWDGVSETMERMPDSNYTTSGSIIVTSNTKVFIAGTNIYFEANRVASSQRLFKLDTVALTVTQITSEAYTGNQNIEIRYFMNGNLYFTALVTSANRKFFVYDGTNVIQLTDTFVGGNDNPTFNVTLGSKIFFTSTIATGVIKNFYVDTLTNVVTRLPDTRTVSTNDNPFGHTIAGGKIFFSGINPSGFTKLYCWDGTTLVNRDNYAAGNDSPSNFREFNGYLYHSAVINASSHNKLFGWDGVSLITPPETNPGGSDAILSLGATSFGLYYRATLSGFSKLFVWNGSARAQISETAPGTNDAPSIISGLSVDGDNLYYTSATPSNGNQIFRVNGATRTQITSLSTSVTTSLTAYQHLGVGFYFITTGGGLRKLYKWDGSSLIAAPEVSPGENEWFISVLKSETSDKVAILTFKTFLDGFYSPVGYTWDGTTFQEIPPTSYKTFETLSSASIFSNSGDNSLVYFYTLSIDGYSATSRKRLIAYDGTSFTPVPPVNNFATDTIDTTSARIIGNRLYFTETTSSIAKSYYYDRTTGLTTKLPDIRVGLTDNPQSPYTEWLGNVYYTANDSTGVPRIVKYDPVANTITPISNIRAAGDTGQQFTVAGDSLYFTCANASGFQKLFRYNGTTITEVSNTRPGASDQITIYGVRGTSLMFTAWSGGIGFVKLFQITGSTVVQVPELVAGATDNIAASFSSATIGTDFYYAAGTSQKIYRWNGSTRTQISNTYPAGTDGPGRFYIHSNNLYVSCRIDATNSRTFRWNGTTLSQPWTATNPAGSDGSTEIFTIGSKGFIVVSNDSTSNLKNYFWDGTSSTLEGPIPPGSTSGSTYSSYISFFALANGTAVCRQFGIERWFVVE